MNTLVKPFGAGANWSLWTLTLDVSNLQENMISLFSSNKDILVTYKEQENISVILFFFIEGNAMVVFTAAYRELSSPYSAEILNR